MIRGATFPAGHTLGAFGSVSGPVVPLLSVLVPVRHGSQSFIAEASWQNVLSLRYSWFPRALLFESSPGPPRSFPHDLPHQSPCASIPPLRPSIRMALDLLGELWKVDLFMMVRRLLHKRPVMYFHKPSVPNSNVFHICCYTNS